MTGKRSASAALKRPLKSSKVWIVEIAGIVDGSDEGLIGRMGALHALARRAVPGSECTGFYTTGWLRVDADHHALGQPRFGQPRLGQITVGA
jgi:hypothetical protein